MSERIHEVLDGELPREALTTAERRELAAFEGVLRRTEAELAALSAPPDLAPGVMARIEALGEPERAGGLAAAPQAGPATGGAAGLLGWLWRPFTVSLRPAWVGAAALVVAAVALGTGGQDAVESGDAAPQVFVHFRLDAPEARSVRLAGDFTGWDPSYELHQTTPGVWSVIVPLAPGVHDYAFVVDGERWIPDPLGVPIDDGFGGQNSRLSVLPPRGARAS